MWKAAFTGRSDKSEVGSSAGGRKKKSRVSDSTASGPSSRRQSEDKKSNNLTEGAIRALNGANADPDDDGEWEDEDKDARSERRSRKGTTREHDRKRKSTRSERARSDSRERYNEKEREQQRRSKQSRSSKNEGRESTDRALPDMGSMEQFPGQHAAMLGPMGTTAPNVTMSGALPSSAPNDQFSFGAAADYYQDQGQSVQSQPGVRPTTPNMLVNPASHLITPSVQPNPAQDTGNGSAAGFYNAQPDVSSQPSSSKPSKKPSKTSKISGTAAASAAGIGALGIAASSMSSTNQSASASYQSSTYPQTQSSGRPSSHSNNAATMAAATAAGAGLAAYGLSQHHTHSTPQRPQSNYSHHPSAHFHEHKGPVTRLKDGLLNLISSPEDVQRMEEYTEYIGVCKYCFDPHSSPVNAPRRHHYHKRRDSFEDLRRRRSNEKLRRRDSDNSLRRKGSIRVGKDKRYFSEATHRRDSHGNLVATGLAAAGLAAGAGALFNDRKDFDDTYSVKSGHRESSAMRQRSRSSSRERRRRSSHGVVGGKEEYVTVRTRDGKIERRKIVRRTRSKSADRRDGKSGALIGAALGAAAASAVLGSSKLRRQPSPQTPARRRSSRSPHRNGEFLGYSDSKAVRQGKRAPDGSYYNISRRDSSPQQSNGLFGGFFSTPERDSRRKPRKNAGLFTFSNGSSSSSDSGMAFGDGFASRSNLSLNKRKARRNSDERIAATVAGIGATAAALTAAQKRRNMDPRAARADLLARRKPEKRYTQNVSEDDEWEDELPSDVSDGSSVSNSGLAFGGSRLSHRQSMESVSSGEGGLGAWAWRWGSSQSKKSKRRVDGRKSSYSNDAVPGYSGSTSMQSGAGSSSLTQPPMQYVDPRPLQEVDSQFSSRHASASMPGSWNDAVRPSDPGPIQAPRPIPAQQASFVQAGQQFDDAHTSRPYPTRTQSSPVQSSFAKDAALIGGAALATAGIIAGSRKGKEPAKDVRFGLTNEQQRKEDKTAQRRQERAERRAREAEEERQRAERAQALKDEAARAARVEDARIREEEVRRRREDENRRAAELELARQAENRRAEELERQNRRSSNAEKRGNESQQSSRRRESSDYESTVKGPKEQRRKSSGYSQPRVDDVQESTSVGDSSRRTEVLAGAAAAVAAGAAIAYANKERDEPKSGRADDRRYQTNEVVPNGNEHSDTEIYSAKKVTPDASASGTPMMDDDILDKDFFKRKRSDSEFAREERRAEIARKAADEVVADMDDYYNQPAQDQADFFAPKELLSQPSEGKTRVADPNSDNDVHVYHVEEGSPIHAFVRSPIPLSKNKHAPYGVPSLNVIAPTPPPSATSSVRGKGSTPSSPLAKAVDTNSQSPDEPTRRTASDNPRRISWGQDKTHIYDAQTPESYEERDSYMDARDAPVTDDSNRNTAFANVVMQAVSSKTPQQKQDNNDRDKEASYNNGAGNGSARDASAPFPMSGDFASRGDAPQSSEPAESNRDADFAPVLTKKEQKRLEKAARSRDALKDNEDIVPETQLDSSAVPEAETVDAWEPQLSKKERKKREKAAAKRLSLAEEETPSTSDDVPAPVDPRSEIVVTEEADEPFLTKKEKKKRDKAAKRMSLDADSFNNDKSIEPEAEISTPEVAPEIDLSSLSKKERKKAEKEVKKQGFADIASALMTPAGITAVANVVDVKKEESTRDVPMDPSKTNVDDANTRGQGPPRMPGSWDDDNKTEDKDEVVDPFQFQVTPTPPPVEDEEDPFEGWSSKKKKKSKKRESATFNEPIVPSPLKTSMASADSSDQAQPGAESETYQSPSMSRAPELVRTESVASAPTLEQYRLAKVDSNDSGSRETDPDAYENRSVAASEPVDLYESVRKSKHRSKHDDDDDAASTRSKRRSKRLDDDDDTASVRSRRDRDDSNGPKKEKRGSLLSNIFSRKSTDSVPQRRQSVPDVKAGSDDEADRKHRKKKHRDSRHEDDDDDAASSRYDGSDSKRKRRDRDKRDEDSRERRRSRESSARKADTDDEREVARRRSRAETSPSRDGGEEYQQNNDDQSFLGMRVEDPPSLPAHRPESPVAASATPEKGFGTPFSAAQELQPALSLETLQRTPVNKSATSTAVPLRFPFGPPKLSPRERTPSFSTPSATSVHASPTSSHKKNRPSSSEIRPLYLVERTRKIPEVEESLPSLPSSNPSSRSSSVHDSDNRAVFDNVQQYQRPLSLDTGGDHANEAKQDEAYLDSAQTTPKASQINLGFFPSRESRPQPQFYTWDDFRADELLHDKLSQHENDRPRTFEEDVPPLPDSRPGSPYESELTEAKSSNGFANAAMLGGAAALAFAAGSTLASSRKTSTAAEPEEASQDTRSSVVVDDTDFKVSRKQSKKAKKKARSQAWEPEEDSEPQNATKGSFSHDTEAEQYHQQVGSVQAFSNEAQGLLPPTADTALPVEQSRDVATEEPTADADNFMMSRKLSKKEKKQQKRASNVEISETAGPVNDPEHTAAAIPTLIDDEPDQQATKKSKKAKRKSVTWDDLENAEQDKDERTTEHSASGSEQVGVADTVRGMLEGEIPEVGAEQASPPILTSSGSLVDNTQDRNELPKEEELALHESPRDISADVASKSSLGLGIAAGSEPREYNEAEDEGVVTTEQTEDSAAASVQTKPKEDVKAKKKREKEKSVASDTVSIWSSLMFGGKKKKKDKKSKKAQSSLPDDEADDTVDEPRQDLADTAETADEESAAQAVEPSQILDETASVEAQGVHKAQKVDTAQRDSPATTVQDAPDFDDERRAVEAEPAHETIASPADVERSLQTLPTPGIEARVSEATNQAASEDSPAEDVFTTKKSKKDKKKAKKARESLLSSETPFSEDPQTVDEDQARDEEPASAVLEHAGDIIPVAVQSSMETDLGDDMFPVKMSKKDKKKAKKAQTSLLQEGMSDTEDSTAKIPDPAPEEIPIDGKPNDTVELVENLDLAGEPFVTPTKQSKKDKKKAKKLDNTFLPADDAMPTKPDTTEREIEHDTLPAFQAPARDDPTSDTIHPADDANPVDDFWPVKQSKKDKKKAKKARDSLSAAHGAGTNDDGAVQIAEDDPPPESDPAILTTTNATDGRIEVNPEHSASPQTDQSAVIVENINERPLSPLQAATTLQREVEAADEGGPVDRASENVQGEGVDEKSFKIPGQFDDDEPSFVLKPSKKDKKKAKKARNPDTDAEIGDAVEELQDPPVLVDPALVQEENDMVSLPETQPVLEDDEYTLKKSKKDKKKAKKARNSAISFEHDATTEPADVVAKDNDDVPVPSNEELAPAIPEDDPIELSKDVESDTGFTSKKSKKDKKKAKKARESLTSAGKDSEGHELQSLDQDLPESVATKQDQDSHAVVYVDDNAPESSRELEAAISNPQENVLLRDREVQEAVSTEATKEDTAVTAVPEADPAGDDEWAGFATKRTKKDKKKKKRQSNALSNFDDASQPTATMTSNDNSLEHTREPGADVKMADVAASVPLPKDDQDDWTMDTSTSSKAMPESREHAAESNSTNTADIGFAATLAAGLAGTGFDPEIVLKDADFHRRQSPPATLAEADPEEFNWSSKKKKKSKQKKPSTSAEDAAPETTRSSSKDFLDDVLDQSLQGTGFDTSVLSKAALADAGGQSSADLPEGVDRSIASWSRAKSPKLRKSSSQSEDEQGHMSYKQQGEATVQTIREIKSSDTPHDSSDKDPASDFNVADGREMDIDEMDRQYRAFRKKEKKKRKSNASQAIAEPDQPREAEQADQEADLSRSLDQNQLHESGNRSHIKDIATAAAVTAPTWSFAALAGTNSSKQDDKAAQHADAQEAQDGDKFVTPTKSDWELSVPKHGQDSGARSLAEDDIRPRTPSGASSAAKTPLEPTSKNRASYLFQSPPVYGPAESPAQVASTSRDLQHVTTQASPSTSARQAPTAAAFTPTTAPTDAILTSIPEEGSASKRAKPVSDVGDPGHVKAIDRTETPQHMRQVTPGRPGSGMSINTDPRPFSRTSNRSGTPSLRRVDRSVSGDLRAASRRGSASSNLNMRASPRTIPFEAPPTPPSYDDEEDVQPMSDIFVGTRHSRDNHALTHGSQQGYGGAEGSQVSPTRPPSVRKRQSMQITELETRLDQLVAENRALHDAQRGMDETSGTRELRDELATRELHLREKDVEITQIRTMLQPLQEEVARLTEINAGLTEANRNLVDDTNGRYATLQTEHAQAHEQWQSAARELDGMRAAHTRLTSGMRDVVEAEIASALADKNAEILRLREELDVATERVRALQVQIQSNKSNDTLVVRDEDYFDGACQKLCQHVQQWVLRFSKLSDNRVCRLSTEINDDKIEGRIDNAILDGSDADALLGDRVRRRDVFMCVVMTMAWEYIFTRYLFGMDREQRQKLKTLEKMLSDVGPPRAVAQWRALTLTLLSKRPEFAKQTSLDTEAVAHEIFSVLCTLLPPPSQAENQLLVSLQKVIGVAVDLSIEMRTQRAEYIMLPPLQPEYDSNGDLVRQVHFNASLMNERSGMFSSNEELEHERAVVKIVLFPLVVKKGDDYGEGEEEIVVCPAQVLVQNETNAKGKKVVRVMSGAMEIDDPRKSRQSLVSTAPGSVAF